MIAVKLSEKENIVFDFKNKVFIYTSAEHQEKGIPPIMVSGAVMNRRLLNLKESSALTDTLELLFEFWKNTSADKRKKILSFSMNNFKTNY